MKRRSKCNDYCYGIQLVGKKLSLSQSNLNKQFIKRKFNALKIDYSCNESFQKVQNKMYRTHSQYFHKQFVQKQKNSLSPSTQKLNAEEKRRQRQRFRQRPLSCSSKKYNKNPKQNIQINYQNKYRPFNSKFQIPLHIKTNNFKIKQKLNKQNLNLCTNKESDKKNLLQKNSSQKKLENNKIQKHYKNCNKEPMEQIFNQRSIQNSHVIPSKIVNKFMTQVDDNNISDNPAYKEHFSNGKVYRRQIRQVLDYETKYTSVGTQTEQGLGSEQSYKQFLRYKYVQKQKYQKLIEVFQFIQQMVSSEPKKFSSRMDYIKKNYQAKLIQPRQLIIVQLLQDIFNCENNLLNDFNLVSLGIDQKIKQKSYQSLNFFNNIQKNIINLKNQLDQILGLSENNKQQQNQILKNSQLNHRNSQLNHKELRNSQYSLKKSLSSYNNKVIEQNNDKFVENTIQNQILCKYNIRWNQFFKQFSSIKISQIIKSQNYEQYINKQLKEAYYRLQKLMDKIKQKNGIVRSCIDEIVKLPQISVSIYGMGQDQISKDTNSLLEQIGIFLKGIPQFSQFSHNSTKQKQLQGAGQVFKELINYKCFACSYMKSKMKFIYQKNRQLVPILKILNHIV